MKKTFYYLLIILFSGCLNAQENKEELSLTELINHKAIGLNTADDLSALVEAAGKKKLVLLGESTHGTSEFYTWRAEISKRLVSEKGFSFIVVEGDWASIYNLNSYVKDLPGAGNSAREVVKTFNRWPEWMWANEEITELAEWLRKYNDDLPAEKKAGFYGMDVYGQWEAMEKLIEYVETEIPDKFDDIKEMLACFTAYGYDEWQYARAVFEGSESCEIQLESILEILKDRSGELKNTDSKKFFNAKQNALVLKNAEEYYRLAVRGGADSWNSRVFHMNYTVNRLLEYYGEHAKGIVWAHNTHIGDAAATSMLQQNMVNIGHITRQEFGRDNVFLVGFSTYTGTVMAGIQWGAQMQVMNIPEGRPESFEHIFNSIDKNSFYILIDEKDRGNEEFMKVRGHRAIGVVFNPAQEARNYVPTLLPERYDAFIFFKETKSLLPVN